MPAERTTSGRCLCGAVTYRATGPLSDVTNCHCERCRRFTGHHMAASAAAVADLHIEDETGRLTWHPVPGASYGFCRSCGSSLFWRADSDPAQMSICAGTLDTPTGLTTVEAWWTSQASDYFTRSDLPEFLTE
jgi:hypothetical protein